MSYIYIYPLNVCWNLIELEEILREAEHRWLRPAEISEILRNYQKFKLTPDPPVRPPGIAYFSLSFIPLLTLVFGYTQVKGIHFSRFRD